MKKQAKYAYVLDGQILYETIDSLKVGAGRRLWRCFPMSMDGVKKKLKLAKIKIELEEYIDEEDTKKE